MLKNYLISVIRTIKKHKTTSFINIGGLSLGISVCLFLFIWVHRELSYDNFHENSENIYRSIWEGKIGVNSWSVPLVSPPLGNTLKREFPEVENTTNFYKGSLIFNFNENLVEVEDVVFTDDSFFDVFSVEFILGQKESLTAPYSVVVTKDFADRYLNNGNPIGQTIITANGQQYQITAVVQKFPSNSHFQFTLIAPLNDLKFYKDREDKWGYATVYNYFSLIPGTDIEKFRNNVNKYISINVSSEIYSKGDNYNLYSFQQLEDIHLRSDLKYELEPNGDILYVYIFISIAFMVLLLAVINFVNISLAQVIEKVDEAGIRKVLGSTNAGVITHSLLNTFINVFSSALLAVIIVETSSIWGEKIIRSDFIFSLFETPELVLPFFVFIVLLGLLTGGYPAFYFYKVAPIAAIKKRIFNAPHQGKLKTCLVAVQFVIATCIVIGTVMVYKQLVYLQEADPGFEKEQVVIIKNVQAIGNHSEAFKQQLLKYPGIIDATGVQYLPGHEFDSTIFDVEQPASVEKPSVTYSMVDENFVDVLKLKLVKGRNFEKGRPADSISYLINEAAAKELGWTNPIGKKLSYGDMADFEGPVIGIIKDFNFQSMHHKIKPVIFPFNRFLPRVIAARILPENINGSLEHVKYVWGQFVNNRPFEYSFLDREFDGKYNKEKTAANLLLVFTVLSIVIAVIGLLGMVTINVKNRIKEIAIRKVLGATSKNIYLMITKELLLIIAVSSFIAWPVVYFSLNEWLKNFAYKVNLDFAFFAFFAFSSIFLISIALLVTGAITFKAAFTNPVKSLRDE